MVEKTRTYLCIDSGCVEFIVEGVSAFGTCLRAEILLHSCLLGLYTMYVLIDYGRNAVELSSMKTVLANFYIHAREMTLSGGLTVTGYGTGRPGGLPRVVKTG